MRLLIDTNILIPVVNRWTAQLPAAIGQLLESRHSFVVSAASLWEVAIKARLGKLPLQSSLSGLPDLVLAYGFSMLPVEPGHVVADLDPEPETRDPFDRLLLAQCQVEKLRLVTTDGDLSDHPLTWRPASA